MTPYSYVTITHNEEKATGAVRRGELTRVQAAKKYKVNLNTLNTLCRIQGLKATLGRPRKKKK